MEAGLSRDAIVERERNYARPAAVSGFIAAAFLIAGVVARVQVPFESNASDQAIQYSVHSQAVVISGILTGIGFFFVAGPLVYLLTAAAARSPRVRAGLVSVCVLGPVLFGVQGIVGSFGFKSSGDEYRAKQSSVEERNVSVLQKTIDSDPKSLDEVKLYNSGDPQNKAEVQTTKDDFYFVTFPAGQESSLKDSLDAAGVDTSEDSGGKPGDAYANFLTINTGSVKVAGYLAFPAGILLIFAVVYSAIQAFRVGLITRLFSTLGAIAAASIFLSIPPVLIGLWASWLGIIYLNRLPSGRPPAWDAGVAVPWPRPGEPAVEAPIEGTAREVDPDASAPNAPRQRGERRKRKSRG